MAVMGSQLRRQSYRPFTLTLDLEAPRIVISRRSAEGNGQVERLAALKGRPAEGTLPAVLEMLHRRGFSLPRLEAKGRGRLRLDENLGARVTLLLWALRPVRKPARWALLRAGVLAMVDEEVSYWFAKAAGYRGRDALKALRILLAGE